MSTEMKDKMALRIDGRGKQTQVTGKSLAMLKLWAMQNTWGKAVTYVADENRKVIMIVKGHQKDFPEIIKDPEEMYLEEA